MELSDSETVALPDLQTLKLHGAQDFLNRIEAHNIKTLAFHCYGQDVDLSLSQPVSQLSEMTLDSITLGSRTFSNPLCLPNLSKLTLECVFVEGPLREYLNAPNLKQLYVNMVDSFQYLIGDWENSLSKLFSNPFFGQGFPELETLSVSRRPLYEGFVADLEQCLRLQYLNIDIEAFQNFIPAFIERIEDKNYLPSLRVLQISCERWVREPPNRYYPTWSWPSELDLPYQDFYAYCTSKRPGMGIISDVRSES
jgi:hypothetical protein